MLLCNSLLKLSTVSITLVVGLMAIPILNQSPDRGFNLVSTNLAQSTPILASTVNPSRSLVALIDGDYQFCSQPEPTDWLGGAGVCFNFNKLGHYIEGYYGYPHSDRFICLRGEVEGNQVTGEALTVSWAGHRWNEIPTSTFEWDDEERLTLAQGEIVRTSSDPQNQEEWIVFHRAVLNIDGFYQYSSPRMPSPSQLCNFL